MKEYIMLEECPLCRGAGMIMHEGGWSVQVECADCSAHTVYVESSGCFGSFPGLRLCVSWG